MKTRTSTIKNFASQLRNTRKQRKAHNRQQTSFAPRLENLEPRALLATLPGLSVEPTTDDAVLVSHDTGNQDTLILSSLDVDRDLDKSSPKIAESVCKGKVFPKIVANVPDNVPSGTSYLNTEIAGSQRNDAAYVKLGDIMSTPETTTPTHHAAVDQLFSLEGVNEGSLAANGLWV